MQNSQTKMHVNLLMLPQLLKNILLINLSQLGCIIHVNYINVAKIGKYKASK